MSEYNICSVLVHAKLKLIESVKAQLELQQGVEVHATTENGRLVVTVEDALRKNVSQRIMEFHQIVGVLSASMIYQFSGDDLDESESIDIIDTENVVAEKNAIESKLSENTLSENKSSELKSSEKRMSA